jgi:GNAT superfamily N-acetyltransferase
VSYMMVPLRPFRQETFRFSIREVSSGYERRRFARSVRGIYQGDLYGVPPLLCRRSNTLNPARNPALASAEMGLFLAESSSFGLGSEQVVGTIAALVDHQYNEAHKANVGFFGLFETINNQEVATALLEAAETWIVEHLPGIKSVRGPAGLDCPYLPGILIDGFHLRPSSFLPYNPPCYPELIETAGYERSDNLLVYSLAIAGWTPAAQTTAAELRAGRRLTIRRLSAQELSPAGGSKRRPAGRVFRNGWMLACGAATLKVGLPYATVEGVIHLVERLKPRLDPALALTCEHDGEPIAAALALPDAGIVPSNTGLRGHQAWHRSLLPGRLWQWMSSLKPDGIWVLPASVEPASFGQGLEKLLYSEITAIAARRGYRHVEFWPVAADDAATRQILESIGARVSKVYQVYEKVF